MKSDFYKKREIMKKIICAVLGILFMLSLSACTSDTAYQNSVANENAEFTITVDKNEISGKTAQVNITVEAVAKKEVMVNTSSENGIKDGAVWFECYMILDGEEYTLYNNYYGIDEIAGYFKYNMQKGEKSTRTMQFSRFPVQYSNSTTKEMPKGKYKVRVKLTDEKSWTETHIVINAK